MSVASGVTIPQLGERTVVIKPATNVPDKPVYNLDKDKGEIPRSYLREISRHFTFTEDVVRERGPETLPYRFHPEPELFHARELYHSQPKLIGPVGRHNPRGPPLSHIPCCFSKGGGLEEAARWRAKSKEARRRRSHTSKSNENQMGLTGHVISTSDSVTGLSTRDRDSRWEEFILTKLSHSAAELIAHRASGEEKEKLLRIVTKRREKANLPSSTENFALASHTVSDTQTSVTSVDEPKLGLTAYSRAACPNLREFKDEVFMKGALPVHQRERSHTIRLDNELEYEKRLRVSYPQEPGCYSVDAEQLGKPRRVVKGQQRWRELPALLEVTNAYQ